ncbi:MAG: thiamine-phosphate kinase [Gammaproteobacteria bacterium]
MDERALIRRYFSRSAPLAGERSAIIVGIGDDGAVLRPEPGYDLVVAIDTLVEGTHFLRDMPSAAVGHRCLAVNLSDVAAMAAEPRWAVLALAIPEVDEAWLSGFADGLFALADRYNVALVGGDTVRGPLAATVTIHGQARPGQVVQRRGAQPGDGVWVTGSPGDAVAGRLLLMDPDKKTGHDELRQELIRRFLFPEPRVLEGQQLSGLATAMLDVSDGLHDDLGKLLAASNVGAEMDIGCLPLSTALQTLCPRDAIEHALTGGDDYELCFTVPAAAESSLLKAAESWPVSVTRIGTIIAGEGARWSLDGRPYRVPDSLWQHF